MEEYSAIILWSSSSIEVDDVATVVGAAMEFLLALAFFLTIERLAEIEVETGVFPFLITSKIGPFKDPRGTRKTIFMRGEDQR
jgi:hypothetical protein